MAFFRVTLLTPSSGDWLPGSFREGPGFVIERPTDIAVIQELADALRQERYSAQEDHLNRCVRVGGSPTVSRIYLVTKIAGIIRY